MCIAVAITLFVVTNVTCAVIIRSSLGDVLGVFQAVSLGRVAINDTLFIVFGVTLAAYIYKMSKMSTSEVVLEARVSHVSSWFHFLGSYWFGQTDQLLCYQFARKLAYWGQWC